MSSDHVVRFVDRCLNGDSVADEIDDFVDQWHESATNESLAEFLGFMPKEYALWVKHPSALDTILDARRKGSSLSTVVPGSLERP